MEERGCTERTLVDFAVLAHRFVGESRFDLLRNPMTMRMWMRNNLGKGAFAKTDFKILESGSFSGTTGHHT